MIVLFVCLFVFCHQTISNLSAIHRDSRGDVRYTDKFYFMYAAFEGLIEVYNAFIND